MKRENEGENMVWNTLRKSINWVEGVTSKWGGHNPFVMRLVDGLVDALVMKPAVNEVNPEIGKHQKQWELEPQVPLSVEFNICVQLRIATNFSQEERGCENSHNR